MKRHLLAKIQAWLVDLLITFIDYIDNSRTMSEQEYKDMLASQDWQEVEKSERRN